jgi:hypothetical protein
MATPETLFVDTDIALDHLADRMPFAEFAHQLFGLGEMGAVNLAVSSLTLANLFYILRKVRGRENALILLAKFRRLVEILPVGAIEIDAALGSSFSDFEDALQHFAARADGRITTILTRNGADYASSELPVMSAEEYLARKPSATS